MGRLHVANSWIGSSGDFWFNHTIDTSFPFIEEPSSYTYRTSDLYYMEGNYAVRYRESDGDVQKSGNYLCFPYMSEERWCAEETDYEGLAYVDYSRCDIGSIYGWTDTARLTGYFEGNEFILLRLETVKGPEYQPVYMRYALEWETQFVDPPLPEKGTVVIYTSHLQQIRHDIGGAVTIDGVVYQDLMEVLSQNYVGEDNLKNTVVICDSDFVDHTGELVNVSIALKVNPLAYTLRKLTWFYLLSFLILAAAVGLYLWYVWRKLTAPLERITQAVAAGSALPEDVSTACWQEPLLLQEYYATTYRTAHENQTEIKRLQTALEYARNAEENRRRMISNITHELKTPLAVIHSYAEGLQDGIAADKQDQYLNIILEETVKMDAMVLEMLELSRLEAGKVRLASDRFVLSGLVQSVFEKLEPLAKEKDLKIRYDLLEAFEITADESRIGQVITNFVTNAI